MIAGRHAVVTGGAGFIGRHLVAGLLARDARRVTIVDRAPGLDGAPLPPDPRLTFAPLTLGAGSAEVLTPIFSGVDTVFHLAAVKHHDAQHDPARAIDTNVGGTEAVARAAVDAGVRRIVFASSLYAYGRMSGPPMVETETPAPDTLYGQSKLAGEQALRAIGERHNLPVTLLRYFFAYGPLPAPGLGYPSVITATCRRLLRGERPIITGDGRQALDYVFIDDLVDATITAAEHEGAGDVFNIGSGYAATVNEVVATLCSGAGAPYDVEYAPADHTAGSCRVADVAKAQARLGWRPRTTLRDGLHATWRAFAGAQE